MKRNLKIKSKTVSAIVSMLIMFVMLSCSGNSEKTESKSEDQNEGVSTTETAPAPAPAEEVDPMKDKGIGPTTSVEIGTLDKKLAAKGQLLFEAKCSACHKLDTKYVGPALGGVTNRRTPEWIMNMIMNPVEMTQKDPIAIKLLEEHLTQMTFQDVKLEESREILEYFRSVDAK